MASVCLSALAAGSAAARSLESAQAAAALRCQQAVASAAAGYAAARYQDDSRCIGGLARCILGRGSDGDCGLRADASCALAHQRQATLEATLRENIRKRCDPGTLTTADAIGFSQLANRCETPRGVALDDLDKAIACLAEGHSCSGSRLLVTGAPRAVELVRTSGNQSSWPAASSCAPDYGGTGAAIVDPVQRRQAGKCITAMLRAGDRDGRAWRAAYGKCLAAAFACTQEGGDEVCWTRAAAACATGLRKLPGVDPASVVVDGACAEAKLPFAQLAASNGANVAALAASCRTVGIASLASAADWRACVARTAACQAAETMTYVSPHAEDLLAQVGRSLRSPFCPGYVPVPTLTPTPTATKTATPVRTKTPTPTPTATVAAPCDLDPAPYGLTSRPSNATCRLDGSPDQFPKLQVERAFPALGFTNPVQLTHAPDGTDRVFVVEQDGTIRVFPNVETTSATTLFLDLTSIVQRSNEEGLLGLAFHPAYATNGFFYVYYSAANPRRSVIARYHVSANANRADSASQKILLEIPQPYDNHNGGQLAFGPDGMLYVSLGDGGSAGDPENRAQDKGQLLGKILRLDVDHTEAGLAYAVPSDNPFVGVPGARGEIWALGLRNPWRMSFDRLTQALWAGDVGQNDREEIDIIERGANYGWRRLEGNACYNPTSSCDDGTFTAPVTVYTHAESNCSVVGGFVYRGTRLPELYGAYVYGDYCSGKLWALHWDGATATVQALATSGFNLSAFGEDRDGEIYVLNHPGGGIYRLGRTQGAPLATFPLTLSATGCFDDLATRHPAPGVLPYDVQSPLWSDGAGKRRFLALPDGATIGHRTTGAWDFPQGTVLVKEFTLELERGNPASAHALETRFLVRRANGWDGYTYQWNEAQTEAYLSDGASTQTFAVTDPQNPGVPQSHTHYFPSRNDCVRCHTSVAGGTLGLQTAQLNRTYDYGAVSDNQLRSFEHLGLFGACLPARPASLPRLANPADPSATLEARARSYLHANCAHCHRAGGTAPTAIDLRSEIALAATGMCGLPQEGNLGVSNAKIVRPGHAEESVLWLRAALRGSGQMPPLATLEADPTGSNVLADWITALGTCP